MSVREDTVAVPSPPMGTIDKPEGKSVPPADSDFDRVINDLLDKPLEEDPAIIGQVQADLKAINLFDGPITRQMGWETIRAIRDFKRRSGLPDNADITERLLSELRTAAIQAISKVAQSKTGVAPPQASSAQLAPSVPPQSTSTGSNNTALYSALLIIGAIVVLAYVLNRAPASNPIVANARTNSPILTQSPHVAPQHRRPFASAPSQPPTNPPKISGSERWTCRKCRSQNWDTDATCWACTAPR